MEQARAASSRSAATVMRAEAPVGTAARLSQFYRRNGLHHGAFRASVRAAPIRGRGSAIRGLQGKTIGSVIGPIGRNAFTRAWIELGVAGHERPNPWVERIADMILGVARDAADAVLTLYADG